MFTIKGRFGLALSTLFAVALIGCGGDGGSSASSGNASLRMTMAWPEPTRTVPNAANSVVTIVTVKGKEVARALFVRPNAVRSPGNGGSTTILLQRLPAGEATVSYAAYPSADGTGVAQATGVSTETLRKGEIAEDAATMASTVETLTLTPNPIVVAKNGSTTLGVEARDAQNRVVLLETRYRESLDWSSSAEDKATVNDNGSVSGVAMGTANITVSMVVNDAGAKKTASAPVTVTAPVVSLVSIALTPNSPSYVFPNGSKQFTATGTYSDGSTADVTGQATWNSSNPIAATVDAAGLVTGTNSGYGQWTNITASLNGVASPAVRVDNVD